MTGVMQPHLATEPPADLPRRPSALTTALVTVIALAVLAVVGAGGYVLGHRAASNGTPDAHSVDAGFAWDMSVHHLQAVTMAGYVRDHTTDGVVKELAYDIETSQFNQVGQMQGWLDDWGLPPQNPYPQMAWMSASGHPATDPASGLMPGMATQAQLGKLETMTGTPMDVYFLQLMLHHHQGGLPMAQWAAEHAQEYYVRNAAQKMATGQSAEIVLMEKLLRERGASPLPPPS
ncbi:MAG TPA: DUF305 domain-containing protein [Jatrophihabitans sp.]|nr:DUF305 domain-containing protein [Jatrophihabitans sp.]